MQVSGSISALSLSTMAVTGHESTQAPQPIHSSVTFLVMIKQLLYKFILPRRRFLKAGGNDILPYYFIFVYKFICQKAFDLRLFVKRAVCSAQ